jgi:hypothetical protein
MEVGSKRINLNICTIYAVVLCICNFRGYEGTKRVELDVCIHVV